MLQPKANQAVVAVTLVQRARMGTGGNSPRTTRFSKLAMVSTQERLASGTPGAKHLHPHVLPKQTCAKWPACQGVFNNSNSWLMSSLVGSTPSDNSSCLFFCSAHAMETRASGPANENIKSWCTMVSTTFNKRAMYPGLRSSLLVP